MGSGNCLKLQKISQGSLSSLPMSPTKVFWQAELPQLLHIPVFLAGLECFPVRG